MPLSPWIREQIRDGRAILFLGAGAVKGAAGDNGEKPLTGEELRNSISNRFLDGEQIGKPLAQVAELAKYESSLKEVQRFVHKLFSPLSPADFHLLIPKFRWFAIVTTNYDFVIEKAYHDAQDPMQKLVPIKRDGDRFAEAIGDINNVPYLKLHGCLSEINDENLPLILASEEYARHKEGRGSLFKHFEDWAREHTVIFCGYDISDPNIQQIMFDLGDGSIYRQQFALVSPSLSEVEGRYWSSRRVQPIIQTFKKFIEDLDKGIPRQDRVLSALKDSNAPSIQSWVQEGVVSDSLKLYLDSELKHVHRDMPVKQIMAEDFYSGAENEWYAIRSNFDVERRITDEILWEAIIDTPEEPILKLFLVKGHAGSGKSTTLRRVAWDASVDFERLVFWLDEGSCIRPNLFEEICRITKERVFIFLDDVLPHINSIKDLILRAKHQKMSITLIFAARTNEWNVSDESIERHIDKEFETNKLSEKEIGKLLSLLDEHGCLGELEYLQEEERREFFRLTADRQLLVALHEATSGKSFKDIVVDEYENIVPIEARTLYQDVCTLHRFKVGVRAGLLSRVSGITFNYFQSSLLRPLEHVVFVYFDAASRDNAYRTRHSIIADIVFREVLRDPEKRANQIVRIISCMNVDYTSDQKAFEQLIRGKDLAELFSDRMYADRIFEAATRAQASKSHIAHQRAVFELHHSAGSISSAIKSIKESERLLGRRTRTTKHTYAAALRRLAVNSKTNLEKEKYRTEAKKILNQLIGKGGTSHSLYTLAQIMCDELSELLSNGGDQVEENFGLNQRIITDLTSQLDEIFHKGRQQFPGESYLLDLESKYANLVNDAPRALEALKQAHNINPENGFVAVRLAKYFERSDAKDDAITVLMRCIEKNSSCKPAHLHLAKILIASGEEENQDAIMSHLNSSFTEGDRNIDAQFWCARHEFLFGDKAKAKRIFESLRSIRVAPQFKFDIRGPVINDFDSINIFRGIVKDTADSYCFIECAELGTELFAHFSEILDQNVDILDVRTKVKFKLGFNFKGPSCFDIDIE